jgi:hypothetical protein
MSAVFLAPTAFRWINGNASVMAPPTNLYEDEPGLVWRSGGTSDVFMVLQRDGSPIDSLAIVDNNLRSSDFYRMRIGATEAETITAPTYDSGSLPAWTGVAPVRRAITLLLLDQAIAAPFVRIDIAAPGHLAGYVEAGRIVMGIRAEHDGVDFDAEEAIEDGSDVEDGLGYTSVDPSWVRNSWKVAISGIKNLAYHTLWRPFFVSVGRQRAFVFCPETNPLYLQSQVTFGRLVNSPKATFNASNAGKVDLTIMSVGQR